MSIIDTVANLRWPDGIPRCLKCVGTRALLPQDPEALEVQGLWSASSPSKLERFSRIRPYPLDKWLTALSILGELQEWCLILLRFVDATWESLRRVRMVRPATA